MLNTDFLFHFHDSRTIRNARTDTRRWVCPKCEGLTKAVMGTVNTTFHKYKNVIPIRFRLEILLHQVASQHSGDVHIDMLRAFFNSLKSDWPDVSAAEKGHTPPGIDFIWSVFSSLISQRSICYVTLLLTPEQIKDHAMHSDHYAQHLENLPPSLYPQLWQKWDMELLLQRIETNWLEATEPFYKASSRHENLVQFVDDSSLFTNEFTRYDRDQLFSRVLPFMMSGFTDDLGVCTAIASSC